MPGGADAVVMVERTERLDGGDAVAINVPAVVGDHVRPAGDDVRPGDEVLPAGEQLTAGHLGLLESLGASSVRAHGRPLVGVLSTGDAPFEGGGLLAPGQTTQSQAGRCEGEDVGGT